MKIGRRDRGLFQNTKTETYKYLYRDDFAIQAQLATIFIAKQIM